MCLDSTKTCLRFVSCIFFFFFFCVSCSRGQRLLFMNSSCTFLTFSSLYHISWSRALFTGPTNITFQQFFLLKMINITLFTYLKIILLQYFQFQFSVSTKISSIQTDPMTHFFSFLSLFLKPNIATCPKVNFNFFNINALKAP